MPDITRKHNNARMSFWTEFLFNVSKRPRGIHIILSPRQNIKCKDYSYSCKQKKFNFYLFGTITLNMTNLLSVSIIYITSKCHKKIENFPIGWMWRFTLDIAMWNRFRPNTHTYRLRLHNNHCYKRKVGVPRWRTSNNIWKDLAT